MDTQRLGMEFGKFFSERLAAHALLWYGLGAAAVGVVQADRPLLGGIAGLMLAVLAASVWLAIWGGLIAQSTQSDQVSGPLILIPCGLALLPFAPLLVPSGFSILLEARWRIWHHRPYVAPPVRVAGSGDIAPVCMPPRARSGGWLFPLLLGLWLGGTWRDGKD